MDQKKVYPPLKHYDYPTLDLYCNCVVCEDWRSKKEEHIACLISGQSSHEFSFNCKCKECRRRMGYWKPFIASSNRRDLYCEGSYHANQNEREMVFARSLATVSLSQGVGPIFMDWLLGQIQDKKKYSEQWWINTAPELSMHYWMGMFATAAKASGLFPTDLATPERFSVIFSN